MTKWKLDADAVCDCVRTSDRSDLFSSSSSLSFFCRESRGKKVGVDTLFSLGRTL